MGTGIVNAGAVLIHLNHGGGHIPVGAYAVVAVDSQCQAHAYTDILIPGGLLLLQAGFIIYELQCPL